MDTYWVHKDGKRFWRAPPSVTSDEIPDAPASSSSHWIYKDGRV
jgi:hypothetical protein